MPSTSPGFLSLFSHDSSPTDDKPPPPPFEDATANRIPRKSVSSLRGPSEPASTPSQLTAAEAARVMLSNMPDHLPIPEYYTRSPGRLSSVGMAHGSKKTRAHEQIKNKPLPKIAFL